MGSPGVGGGSQVGARVTREGTLVGWDGILSASVWGGGREGNQLGGEGSPEVGGRGHPGGEGLPGKGEGGGAAGWIGVACGGCPKWGEQHEVG